MNIANYANSPRAVCAKITSLTMEEKWAECCREKRIAVILLCVKRRKAPVRARFSLENMLKSFMHIKNYKRIILILAFLLLYISMYLIHNAYGTLCIIKSGSGDKDSGGKGDIEVAKLYKANNSNLFVSNVHKAIDWDGESVCASFARVGWKNCLEKKSCFESWLFRNGCFSYFICSRELIYDSKSV